MSGSGHLGETLARRYLVARGWRILARNWRGGGGELDIVALRAGVVVVVEVKARADVAELDDPVRYAQRSRIVRAANAYLERHPELDAAVVRFDLIAVDLRRRWRRVTHIPDAFEMER